MNRQRYANFKRVTEPKSLVLTSHCAQLNDDVTPPEAVPISSRRQLWREGCENTSQRIAACAWLEMACSRGQRRSCRRGSHLSGGDGRVHCDAATSEPSYMRSLLMMPAGERRAGAEHAGVPGTGGSSKSQLQPAHGDQR